MEPNVGKKRHLNNYAKNNAEKVNKIMPKGSKMMAKWMPKSAIFHTFLKKAKTLQTLCFPI